MSKYCFETRMEVRDYECDIEGIVNNANYLHYTEHTRHLFLKACGLSFAEMHEKGVDAVVAHPCAATTNSSHVCGSKSRASSTSSTKTFSVPLTKRYASVATSRWYVSSTDD